MVAWGGAVISSLLREPPPAQWSILITIRNREQKEGDQQRVPDPHILEVDFLLPHQLPLSPMVAVTPARPL
jgi:hypothetical protein